jgi:hypothetical protein
MATNTMWCSLSLFLVSFLLLTSSVESLFHATEEKEIEVIPNPYDSSKAAESCTTTGTSLDGLLEPYQLLTKPIQTQADTFQSLDYVTVLTVPVPVYTMKQPARLSAGQLEFQLVLVQQIASSAAMESLHEVPVDPAAAKDSWFPGYTWAPLVMTCNSNSNSDNNDTDIDTDTGYQHVGWKFTATAEDSASTSSSSLPFFYALMVHVEKKESVTQAVRLGGFKAPGWMVTGIVS